MPLKIPPRVLPSPRRLPVSSSSSSTPSIYVPSFLLPSITTTQYRSYATPPQKKAKDQKRRPQATHYQQYDLSDADQFSLGEAMRYIRAFEVGQDPTSTKYELAVKLHAQKNGPTVKNMIRLPKPVKTGLRICVFAEGKEAEGAKKAGAQVVGTKEVWDAIKKGEINFDKCLCHEAVYPAMQKSGIAPILGPRGLLPNPKFKTVIQNPASAVRDMTGQSDYRERLGVIRMAIGQLGFTEKELAKNIMVFMDSVKKDINALRHKTEKSIVEVVLSSTRGPGLSLSGEIKAQTGDPAGGATTASDSKVEAA